MVDGTSGYDTYADYPLDLPRARRELINRPMMLHRFATNHEPAGFLPGDLVEVRSSAEILSTLDERGALENLPFMPEMLSFSGRQYRVSRRAFKTCVDDQEMRKLENTVFLEDLRCDGKSHGGCAKTWLIFLEKAWLKPGG